MKVIQVVAAAIIEGDRVFCAQRHRGGNAGAKWEFPGGKVEVGETEPQAFKREIEEELHLFIEVGTHLVTIVHDYAEITISLSLYQARLAGEQKPELREHLACGWKHKEELASLDWADADKRIYPKVMELLGTSPNRS